jgi:pimeloyl-ACP methyl ester carboxylesterase
VDLPLTDVRDPDAAFEPEGFTVDAGNGDRIHFLDWGAPASGEERRPVVLAVHGLGQTAWIWTPIARRLGGPDGPVRFLASDLRGHGLSDAPTDSDAYDLDMLAADVLAVAEGGGALEAGGLVLAGHGFGAMVAATAVRAAPDDVDGLLLVDGGWESIERATGQDVDEFLRGLDEPPEVMSSLDAYLADRRAFDPASWDADQDRAARSTIVETHAGRVVPSARPHATAASVRAMFQYDPIETLEDLAIPIVALLAADDEEHSRSMALAEVATARERAGVDPIRVVRFPHDGHNLMRYRPREVAAAILTLLRPP